MKKLSIVYYIFIIVGLSLLTGAYYTYKNTNDFIGKSISANGEVLDMEIGDTYRPIVQFTTQDGKAITFTGSVGSNPPQYNIGENVEVLYIAENPQEAKIKSIIQLWLLPLILGGMGIVFAGVGFGIVFFRNRRKKTIELLKTSGRNIQTDFVNVEMNKYIAINNRHPYNIITQYNENGTVYAFKSDNIWFDPTGYITQNKITVMVAPNNMKKYYMDISFLPKEG
ncbi:DUF3592 domain-containing protein [Candidatus Peregrinibacteria bacterium]|nr:DUF3592 domain-containing protein [Candidatus Peregrinibacteria bacterium]